MSNTTQQGLPANSRLLFLRSFGLWVFSGFGLLGGKNEEEIVVYTVDKGFFLWGLIATGFLGAAWVHFFPGSSNFWGWTYILVLAVTFVALLRELSTWRFAFWAGVTLLAYLLIRYPLGSLGILPGLALWLAGLNPGLVPDTAVVISLILTGIFISSLVISFANGRKTFTPNSIEEWHFGRGSEIQDRGGLRFKTTYRDILEAFFGLGSGDLVAYDRNNRVVKRYENVLFLFFLWNKMDRILHQRFSLVDNLPDEAIAVQNIEHDLTPQDAADQNQP
jgi:hypothetical protein